MYATRPSYNAQILPDESIARDINESFYHIDRIKRVVKANAKTIYIYHVFIVSRGNTSKWQQQ